MALAQPAAGSTTSLTNKAVSLVSRHSPVAAERVSLSRLTRINPRIRPIHPVPSRPLIQFGVEASRRSIELHIVEGCLCLHLGIREDGVAAEGRAAEVGTRVLLLSAPTARADWHGGHHGSGWWAHHHHWGARPLFVAPPLYYAPAPACPLAPPAYCSVPPTYYYIPPLYAPYG